MSMRSQVHTTFDGTKHPAQPYTFERSGHVDIDINYSIDSYFIPIRSLIVRSGLRANNIFN